MTTPARCCGSNGTRWKPSPAPSVRPRLLLLDEPFTALDATLAESLLVETAQLATSFGASLILVSHRPDEARALSCRVVPVEKPA